MNTIGLLFDAFTLWHERMRSRRLLLQMDERLLKDIGMTQASAQAEASKPWWRD